MIESWRLFVALELGDALRGEMRRALHDLPEQLHLTLVFLGNRPPDEVEPLRLGLEPVFATAALPPLRLGSLGGFPTTRAARVLYLGIDDDSGATALLERRCREVIREVTRGAVADERRPFVPHLTVARVRRRVGVACAERLASALAPFAGRPFNFCRGALLRSVLDRRGARHHLLAALPLGARRPAEVACT